MNFHAGVLFAKASHQDTHLCDILFDEPASLSKLACEMEKASHQDTHLYDILFDEPASLSKLACEMEKTQWSAFPVGQPE